MDRKIFLTPQNGCTSASLLFRRIDRVKEHEIVSVLVPYLGSSLGRGEHVVIAPDVEEVSGGSTLGGSLAELIGANRGVAAYSGHHGRGEGCQTRD